MNEVSVAELISTIASYNGYLDWLKELADELEAVNEGSYSKGLPTSEWHTDKHAIWMILVQLFGDWGTSVRSGWISETKECARFIKDILAEFEETEI